MMFTLYNAHEPLDVEGFRVRGTKQGDNADEMQGATRNEKDTKKFRKKPENNPKQEATDKRLIVLKKTGRSVNQALDKPMFLIIFILS